MGVEAMTRGDIDGARVSLKAAKADAPNNPQVCLALTQLFARTKQVRSRDVSARRCVSLAHAVNAWEASGTVRSYLGKVYLANGEFEKAISEYRVAIQINPYEESYRFDLAQALLNHELFPEAVQVLEEAHAVFDKSAQIDLALGVAYYGQRRFPEAVDFFLRTIELAPEVVQPYIFLGKMIDQSGNRLPEIASRFQEFQRANPDNYLGDLLLAKAIAAESGPAAEQERLLRKSIELKSNNWESHYELGILLETQKRYEEAVRELLNSARLSSEIADIHYHLARVYDRLNRTEAATAERQIHSQLNARKKISAGMEVTR